MQYKQQFVCATLATLVNTFSMIFICYAFIFVRNPVSNKLTLSEWKTLCSCLAANEFHFVEAMPTLFVYFIYTYMWSSVYILRSEKNKTYLDRFILTSCENFKTVLGLKNGKNATHCAAHTMLVCCCSFHAAVMLSVLFFRDQQQNITYFVLPCWIAQHSVKWIKHGTPFTSNRSEKLFLL